MVQMDYGAVLPPSLMVFFCSPYSPCLNNSIWPNGQLRCIWWRWYTPKLTRPWKWWSCHLRRTPLRGGVLLQFPPLGRKRILNSILNPKHTVCWLLTPHNNLARGCPGGTWLETDWMLSTAVLHNWVFNTAVLKQASYLVNLPWLT